MTAALSTLNFRDLGGLPAEGGVIRSGLLFRSEGPANFLAEHHAELEGLGIRLICDLRSRGERAAAPHRWAHAARVLTLDMTSDLRSEASEGWAALRADPSADGARRAMLLNYAAMPAALHPQLAGLADALVEGGLPVLIHCTAGKDRTGVLVALLLALVGVREATILEDYLRSEVFAANLRLGGSIEQALQATFGFMPGEAVIAAMIGVEAAYLATANAAIERGWGGVGAYFESAGLSGARARRLREALVR